MWYQIPTKRHCKINVKFLSPFHTKQEMNGYIIIGTLDIKFDKLKEKLVQVNTVINNMTLGIRGQKSKGIFLVDLT